MMKGAPYENLPIRTWLLKHLKDLKPALRMKYLQLWLLLIRRRKVF